MSKVTTVYGRFGKQHFIDDQEVTEAEYAAYLSTRESLEEILSTPEGRKAMSRSLTCDPQRRLGHESESCGVGKADAASHADWVRSQGLTGVEVQTNGNIRFSGSEREKDKYLASRGLQDHSSAGTGMPISSIEPTRKPRRKKPQWKRRPRA